tara:strand:+ start:816 stop:1115 length:300 start_codon:yes stop_codon:yes gene_type:complete
LGSLGRQIDRDVERVRHINRDWRLHLLSALLGKIPKKAFIIAKSVGRKPQQQKDGDMHERLIIMDGSVRGQVFELPERDLLSLGRDFQNGIVVPDPGIS